MEPSSITSAARPPRGFSSAMSSRRFVDQTWGEKKTIGGKMKDGKMGRKLPGEEQKKWCLVN